MSKADNENSNSDLRLIEDYLPIEAISKEASREKSVRKGHISTLHLWWARRPLVACRAAVYGALVEADRWVKDVDVKNPPADAAKAATIANGKKKGLNRKAAKEFVTKLCRYPKTDPKSPVDIKIKRETEQAIADARRHILEAHAERLTTELAEAKKTGEPPAWVAEFKWPADKLTVSRADIETGCAPRPRVLDMFAGGGAIPLEALRLGCEAYALDLNPVAHIIQLCTLVYPQTYGKPDPAARGMTGPKNAKGEATWGGLADEVRHWGNWVLDRVRKEIGDLYPPIPDPTVWDTPPEIAFDRTTGQWNVTRPGKLKPGVRLDERKPGPTAKMFADDDDEDEDESTAAAVTLPPGFLQPVAYLWTRTVRCKNPSCAKVVPLLKQTWLSKRDGRYIAMRMSADKRSGLLAFEVEATESADGLDFDPEAFSKAGNATCPFCGSVADSDYVKAEGHAAPFPVLPMAAMCLRPGRTGKVYVSWSAIPEGGRLAEIERSANYRCQISGLTEPLEANPRSFDVQRYGFTHWRAVFTDRQHAMLISFAVGVNDAARAMASTYDVATMKALRTCLALTCSRLVTQHNAFAFIDSSRETIAGPWGDGKFPMSWDFAEANPFSGATASYANALKLACDTHFCIAAVGLPGTVARGSATEMPFAAGTIDAVVSDPPYYDSVSYSNLADAFYVWLKRSLKSTHPDHFASDLTPKRREAIAAAYRHGNDRSLASKAYEELMEASLAEARRVLKPGGTVAIVYAHKTTLGWATLVDAMRGAGFEIREAWPLDTEMKGGRKKVDRAMLASSIFLVARRRPESASVGKYEDDVQPELQQIVRERVATLWEMGIAGADLVIACVGAGLRAFTKYERVEYANGEEVPAEKFLAEVEAVVLDAMLARLSGTVGGNVSTVDNASRFYVLWRFVYKTAELDAGEAIVFSNGTHIELDGPLGLSTGKDALVEKKKAKYRARDYTERGNDAKLGLPSENGQPAPLIDALHRILWLMENSPRKLNDFLDEAHPDRERLRVLAQALAGAALSGKNEEEAAKLVSTTPAEQAALGKLLANWRSLVESRLAAQDGTLFGKR